MKIYNPLIWLCVLFGYIGVIDGQSIKRAGLCNTGSVQVSGNVRLGSTFGQCPGCGTLFNGENYIRPGFQQPIGTSSIIDSDCFTISFVNEFYTGDCGVYFNFEYTGNADTELATFLWHFGEGATPQTSSVQNPQNIAYANAGEKTIALQMILGGCDIVVDQVLMINPGQDNGLAATTEITAAACFGTEDGTIKLTPTGGESPYTIAWENGATTESLTNLAAGDYAYTITDASSCTYENVVTVLGAETELEIGEAVIGHETCTEDIPNQDGSIDLMPTGGNGDYVFEWSDGRRNEDLEGLIAGTYTVTMTDGLGCSTTGAFVVTNCQSESNSSAEGVFTPNEDGINDVWIIDGIENYPNNEVLIYNRWGSEVYKVKGYMNDWRGTNSAGKDLPSAPYWYVIHLNDTAETIWTGSVTIIR